MSTPQPTQLESNTIMDNSNVTNIYIYIAIASAVGICILCLCLGYWLHQRKMNSKLSAAMTTINSKSEIEENRII